MLKGEIFLLKGMNLHSEWGISQSGSEDWLQIFNFF